MVSVDCHLHLGVVPSQIPEWWLTEMYRPYGGGALANYDGQWIVDLLDRSGVEVGLVQGGDMRRTTYHPDHPADHDVFVPNDYTAEQVALFPDRLKGVAVIDPIRDMGAALEELDRCVNELDFRALKLLGSYLHFSPNDRRLDPIYEKCIELGIAAHFFTGWTPILMARLENADPVQLDEVGRRFRDLKVIISMGDPWIDQCLLLVAKHPNFHADMYHYAELGPEPLFEALDRLRSLSALDRVLYGSNNSDKVRVGRDEATVPDVYRSVNRVARERGVEQFTDEEMAAILGGNAVRLYGLGD